MTVYRIWSVLEIVCIIKCIADQHFDWKTDRIGSHYRGQLNNTVSGRVCQHWSSQKPHKHKYGMLQDEENFCRNPDVAYPGPWCYSKDPNVRWEFCPVYKCGSFCSEGFFKCNNGGCILAYKQCNDEPDCPDGEDELNCENIIKECKDEASGVTYRGKRNITNTGKKCMPWAGVFKEFLGNNNFCRSPTGLLKRRGPSCLIYSNHESNNTEPCHLETCDINTFRDLDYFTQKFDCPNNANTTVARTHQEKNDGSSRCDCSCEDPVPGVLTPDYITSIKRDIERTLRINTRNTSMFRRSKICAPDDRVSSSSIGMVGVLVLVCVTFIIILLDFLPSSMN